MFGLKKAPFNGKSKTVRFVFDKFALNKKAASGASVLLARSSQNCDCRDGAITTGLGLEVYRQDGVATFAYSGDTVRRFIVADNGETLDALPAVTLYCLTESGKLYSYNTSSRTYVYETAPSKNARLSVMAAENGERRGVLSAEGGFYMRSDGTWSKTAMANANGTMCVCKDRAFFGLTKATVAYTAPSAPWIYLSTVDGGGKIRLAYDFGEIVGLISFENRVYVFHEFGVTRMDVEGAPADFKVQPLDYAGGEIYGGSVGVCGNAIFFLAADGAYRFDGKHFNRVDAGISILPSSTVKECAWAVCGEKYVLQYTDIYGENRGVAIAADGKSGYFVSVREGLSFSAGMGLCKSDGYVYRLSESGSLGNGESYKFVTDKTNFGVFGKKTLKKLRFEGEGSVHVYAYGDKLLKNEMLHFENGVAEMHLRAVGEEFYFDFYLNQGARIRHMTAEFSVPVS